jgi:hypothetical protein
LRLVLLLFLFFFPANTLPVAEGQSEAIVLFFGLCHFASSLSWLFALSIAMWRAGACGAVPKAGTP